MQAPITPPPQITTRIASLLGCGLPTPIRCARTAAIARRWDAR